MERMRNRLYFFLKAAKNACFFFVLLTFSNAHAQVIDAQACDSTDRLPITPYTSLLKTAHLIDIDSVRRLNATDGFVQAPDKPVLVFNYDPFYYWFRIVIQNNTAQPKDLMLLMAPIGMREGKLFQRKADQWTVIGETGLKYPFRQRPYPFMHHVFPFSVPAHTLDTLYLSADASNVYKSFGFALIKPKDLTLFENKVYFLFGIIVGLLLLFCLLNVSLFFVSRVNVHLWYALYIGFLFLIVMKNDHLDQEFLHWDSEAAYHLTAYMAIGAFAIAILMHVVMQFLKETIHRNSFLYKLSLAAAINVFLSGLAHYLFFYFKSDYRFLSFAFTWAKVSTLLVVVVIIIDCIYSIIRGFKSAYFVLAGLLVFLIGAVQRLFFPSTLSFLFPPTTFHIGIILETSIISLGLVYQYYWIEKEQDRQRETAFRQELHKAELESKEQTMRTISEEIHDNVGQILSLAKININQISDGAGPQPEAATNASELVGKAIQDLRDLTKILNTDYVAREDLVRLIKLELERVKKTGKYQTVLDQQGEAYKVPHHLVLFRIFQETLNNILKHAHASTITVRVSFQPRFFELQIHDNGKGFDLAAVTENVHSGLGIWNIKNRVHLIGGSCKFESIPDGGTTVCIRLPVSA